MVDVLGLLAGFRSFGFSHTFPHAAPVSFSARNRTMTVDDSGAWLIRDMSPIPLGS